MYDVDAPTVGDRGVTVKPVVLAAMFIVTVSPLSMKFISEPDGPRVYNLKVSLGLNEGGFRMLDKLSDSARLV